MSKKPQDLPVLHQKETINSMPMDEQVYLDVQRYALYTSRHRVTADVRDGLIPVERRIIYTLLNKCSLRKPGLRVKSATAVGAVMHYHPHGDASIYGAVKPLVNWFESKMPLLCKKGNFGNFHGDPYAAARYTEIGFTEFCLDVVLGDLLETPQSVDWVPNYDDKELEPEFLPVKVPLLLINGSFNIGVGMKPEIPSHNLSEVIDATLKLIDDPNADFVLIPDHCMPCEIIDTDWAKVNNGESLNYIVRSKIDIEEDPSGKRGPSLIIRSVPNLTYVSAIETAIEELMQSGDLSQVASIEDLSTDYDCKFIIRLKKGGDPNYVRETIWRKTRAMQTCRVNMEALIDGAPVFLSYREYLLTFIAQRKLTKFRLYSNRHQDCETKIHEKEAFIRILESGEVDKVIELIKKRNNTNDAELVEFLIKRYKITDLQATYIINAKLKYLSLSYLNKYRAERDEYIKIRDDARNKIINDDLIIKEIKNELIAIKKKYGTPRTCPIISDSVSDIPGGIFKVIITKNNFIKKIHVADMVKSYKQDYVKDVVTVDNRDSILIFDNLGRVFKLPVSKIPMSDNRSGVDIRFLVKNLTSDINSVISESTVNKFNEKSSKYFLLVATVQGNIKKMDLSDFITVPPSGILYTKLDQGDYVKSIMIVNDKFDILACAGKSAIRIKVSDVPYLKRNTKGSRIMNTNHPIESISCIRPGCEFIVVITRKGKINKFKSVAIPAKSRGKSGNQVIKLAKGDSIAAAYGVNETDTLYIATQEETYNIPISNIPLGSSISAGAPMISTGSSGFIVHCSVIYSPVSVD